MQLWNFVGNLPGARAFFSSVILLSGKVLLIGGEDGTHANTATSFLFDPALNTWSTTGSLSFGRTDSMSIRMANGKVLTVSGETKGFAGANLSAEVYNPNTGLWTTVAAPSQGHCQGAIWNLPSGKVLVASGFVDTFTSNNTTAITEVYDPVGNNWTTVNPMPYHGANLQYCSLGDGRALVAGSFDPIQGVQKASAIYDENTGIWTSLSGYGGALVGYTSFNNTSSIQMLNGDGLVVGGQDSTTVYPTNYKFSKTTNTWSTIAPLPVAVAGAKLYLQSNGSIVAAAGYLNSGLNPNTYVYNPTLDSWSTAGQINISRSMGGNTTNFPILNDGRAIIAGGQDVGGGTLNSTEVLGALLIGGTMSYLGYYQDQTSAPLTSSYVNYPFGLTAGYLRIDNDDTAGTNKIVWSFDGGVTVDGTVIPGKYVEIQNAGVGAISLKFVGGAPAYRLHAMSAQG